MEPFSIGALPGLISAALKLADTVIDVVNVNSSTTSIARTLTIIRQDLHEAQRLVSLPAVNQTLQRSPEKAAWITASLDNTRTILERLAVWLEPVEADKRDGGRLGVGTRLLWVLSRQKKVQAHQGELAACQQQLGSVLIILAALEPLGGARSTPTPTPTPCAGVSMLPVTCVGDVISPQQRKLRERIWQENGCSHLSPSLGIYPPLRRPASIGQFPTAAPSLFDRRTPPNEPPNPTLFSFSSSVATTAYPPNEPEPPPPYPGIGAHDPGTASGPPFKPPPPLPPCLTPAKPPIFVLVPTPQSEKLVSKGSANEQRTAAAATAPRGLSVGEARMRGVEAILGGLTKV